MFILHSFVLATLLYFIIVRPGVYFERLLYTSVLVCILQAGATFLVPILVIHDTPQQGTAVENQSWMDSSTPVVEERRGTVSAVMALLSYVALAGFLIYWYTLEPLKAAAVVGAFAAYQFALSFFITQVMLMLSTTQQQKIGW
jgi:hypothetical protein